jgi:hypothetical protein
LVRVRFDRTVIGERFMSSVWRATTERGIVT